MSTATTFDLHRFLDAERGAVDRALRRLTARLASEAPTALAEPLAYALESGGKRLRPVLCVAAHRAVTAAGAGVRAAPRRSDNAHDSGAVRGAGRLDGSPATVYDLACALELVHTYSLVHDDLPSMDDDDLRRGRATTHRIFGEARAMVCGAALIPVACRVLVDAARRMPVLEDVTARLVAELCSAAGAAGMVGGQLLDLEAERRSIGADELEELHRRKTGALVAAALRIGGLAAGAGEAALAALNGYGQALGLAFQIADDILDETGRSAQLGKTAGRDRDLGKATYPALMGIGAARETARALAADGIAALRDAGLGTPELDALARYAVERER